MAEPLPLDEFFLWLAHSFSIVTLVVISLAIIVAIIVPWSRVAEKILQSKTR